MCSTRGQRGDGERRERGRRPPPTRCECATPMTAPAGAPRRRPGPGRRQRRPVALAARLAGAGLLAASGGIHLDLYLTSYGSIPTIGPLFLAQAVVALVVALAVALGGRPVAALAGAMLAAGTLGGYVVALLVPLFGFREVRTGAGMLAAAVEIAAAGLLVAAAGLAPPGTGRLAVGRPHAGRSGSAAAAALRVGAGGGTPVGVAAGALVAAVSLAAVALALAFGGTAPPPGSVVVTAVAVPGFGRVLASGGGESYYLLSSEAGGRLVCRGACWSIWPPVLVRHGARPVAGGSGVAGRLGVVRRSSGAEQVTYNGYPLYGYAGDRGARQASGEGIDSFGGIWYLVRAAARTPGTTSVVRRSG